MAFKELNFLVDRWRLACLLLNPAGLANIPTKDWHYGMILIWLQAVFKVEAAQNFKVDFAVLLMKECCLVTLALLVLEL